jgi:DNA-binding MarR family transcriptional regulator
VSGELEERPRAEAAGLAGDLRAVVGKLCRRLREQAHSGDLSSSQVSVIGRLYRDGPATVSTLARAEGMRQQSMGAIVSALEAGGLVIGEPDPTDGRQTILSLTDKARERIQASRAIREDWLLRAIHIHLSPSEQDGLAIAVSYLERIANTESNIPPVALRDVESWTVPDVPVETAARS